MERSLLLFPLHSFSLVFFTQWASTWSCLESNFYALVLSKVAAVMRCVCNTTTNTNQDKTLQTVKKNHTTQYIYFFLILEEWKASNDEDLKMKLWTVVFMKPYNNRESYTQFTQPSYCCRCSSQDNDAVCSGGQMSIFPLLFCVYLSTSEKEKRSLIITFVGFPCVHISTLFPFLLFISRVLRAFVLLIPSVVG